MARRGRQRHPASQDACNVCASKDGAFVTTEAGWHIYKCPDCSLFFVSPQPSLAVDEGVEYYAGNAGEADRHRWASAELCRHGAEMLSRLIPAKGALIDVGAGFGFFVKAACDAGWSAVGVEASPREVAYARETLGADVLQGTLLSASFPQASASAVTMWNLLEHVANPMASLRRAAELLRPGGILLVRVPNMAFFESAMPVARLMHRTGIARKLLGIQAPVPLLGGVSPPQHLFGFTPLALRTAVERAGLRMLSLAPAETHAFERSSQKLVAQLLGAASGAIHRLSFEKIVAFPTMVGLAEKVG